MGKAQKFKALRKKVYPDGMKEEDRVLYIDKRTGVIRSGTRRSLYKQYKKTLLKED